MNNNDYQNEILKLKKQVERLKKSVKKQKYGLVWMDVPEAFEDDVENKLPILKEVPELAIKNDDGKPTHILIEGDNYHALTCLNYTHKGKIDVIYIDPPYNTGIDGFRYKDKRIIDKFPDGTEVPKDHPFRHSYWLSFMKKRLEIARMLMKETGSIIISIDDNEYSQLKMLCDEIFGESNFFANIIWKKRSSPPNDQILGTVQEYLLFYAKNISELKIYRKERSERLNNRYKNPDNHPKGPWAPDNLMANVKGGRYVKSLYFPIINPNTGEEHYPSSNGNWRFNKDKIEELLRNNEIYFGIDGKGRPKLKRFLSDVKDGIPFSSIWDYLSHNNSATSDIKNILGSVNVFDTPKPRDLIREILNLTTKDNDLILDFFAGSGTTGHAVFEQNELDGGNRQCILVTNNEGKIMDEVCYPRIKKIIDGYEYKGKLKTELLTKKISFSTLKNSESIIKSVDKIETDQKDKWSKFIKTIKNSIFYLYGEKDVQDKVNGLGNSIRYYKTAFVGKRNILNIKDEDKVALAHNAGELLALSENTLDLINKDDWIQLYENNDRYTAIYFREEMTNFEEFKSTVKKLEKPVSIYVFSWGDNEFPDDFAEIKDAKVKTIPAPILEIYKQIYNLNTK